MLGYLGLYEIADLVHRDISPHNILLGKKGAAIGFRGMVIDLDMAVPVRRIPGSVCSDPRSVRPNSLSLAS